MRSVLLTSLASIGAIKSVYAHPHPGQAGSHKFGRRTVDLDAFRVKVVPVYKNATDIITNGTLTTRDTPEDLAADLIRTKVPGATFRLATDHYVGKNGIAHYYFKQTINGLDVDTGDFNVNIRDGKVFSFGNSFYQGTAPTPPSLNKRDSVDPVNALLGAVGTLQLPVSASSATAEQQGDQQTYVIKQTSGTVSDPEAKLVYVRGADGNLKLSWRIETDLSDNWLLTYVDAGNGKDVHAVVDYKADVSYEVYPWGLNDPTEGDRSIVNNPFDSRVSPFGWHSDQQHWYKSTRGNNGMAQTNWNNSVSSYEGLPRPYSDTQKYYYPYSLDEPDFHNYANASVTQLFYTANMYHDLMYKLGFTEEAGNFEMNNDGEGGIGNDLVILNAQDGSGLNNANFATPPDGQRPRMRMYIWTLTNPPRDGAFEAGVVIHEHTHGLSNRLTGGPQNSACLNMLESGGMGEGWSDFMATAIRLKPGDTRSTNYAMGAWVSGRPGGIRKFLYSTDMAVNPQTYSSVDGIFEVHGIGGIWCTMLYEVLWNLIDKYGKNDRGSPEFDNSGVPTDGKYLAMKIVMDAMALQPCNPTFVQARDAIMDADKALTNGANACELWTAFAKRGLGELARYDDNKRTSSFLVPQGACNF